jgi:hypothetical protein
MLDVPYSFFSFMRKKKKQELYDQAKLCRKGVDVLVFGAATLRYSLIA